MTQQQSFDLFRNQCFQDEGNAKQQGGARHYDPPTSTTRWQADYPQLRDDWAGEPRRAKRGSIPRPVSSASAARRFRWSASKDEGQGRSNFLMLVFLLRSARSRQDGDRRPVTRARPAARFEPLAGHCPDCRRVEQLVQSLRKCRASSPPSLTFRRRADDPARRARSSGSRLPERIVHRIAEFDRAIGGGILPDRRCVVGGDPGIGKRPCCCRSARNLPRRPQRLYVSGEESAEQVQAPRGSLGLGKAPVG